jgi:hypothetical protein
LPIGIRERVGARTGSFLPSASEATLSCWPAGITHVSAAIITIRIV